MKEMCDMLGIKQIRTSQMDGCLERWHGSLKAIVTTGRLIGTGY